MGKRREAGLTFVQRISVDTSFYMDTDTIGTSNVLIYNNHVEKGYSRHEGEKISRDRIKKRDRHEGIRDFFPETLVSQTNNGHWTTRQELVLLLPLHYLFITKLDT